MGEKTAQNLKRQPVVVVMGHVDHGKTTLLDYIRKANIAAREAGGITQAVGAYEATPSHKATEVQDSPSHKATEVQRLTFIDTPGHEAFSKMRSRGAQAADLAVLVVAAEESIKPQTKEAIQTLKETNTPFVVAITKIDMPGADVDKVKNDLTAEGVLLEGYGGDVSYEPISAKTGENVDKLLDLILLAADLQELSYDPNALPSGFVLETRMNKNRGIEATVIIKNGVLKRGEMIATPTAKGKIKILENFLGKVIDSAPAGTPAVVVGFETPPKTGEDFTAREIAEINIEEKKLPAIENGEEDDLRLILKAGDAGSLEAMRDIIQAMQFTKPVRIISEGIGEITESDAKLAISTGGMVMGFKSKLDKGAKTLTENHNVSVITSDIIYELIKAIEDFIRAEKTHVMGALEVLAVFNQAKLEKQLVGGKVAEGILRNKALFQILRGEEKIGQGRVLNLQSGKKDISQVETGNEAGIIVSSPIPIQKGDRLVVEA